MFRHILVPITQGPASSAAVWQAVQLAKRLGGRIRFFHLLCDHEEVGWTKELLQEVLGSTRLRYELHLQARKNPDIASAILDFAEQFQTDLIVLGHQEAGYLGQVTQQVAANARVPVQIVPPIQGAYS